MADEIKYIDVDSEEFEDAPRALREHVKKLQASLTAVQKDRDEARGLVASRAVADVLADKNFKNPDRVRKDLLEDGIDPLNQAAVDGWLAANGDDYAKAPAQAEVQEGEAATPVDSEVEQAYGNLQVAGEPAVSDKFALVLSKITPDMDGQAVAALYKEHGI